MITLCNGQRQANVPADNRGLAYGDGLFETILVRDGQPHWLAEHLARLRRGCRLLDLDFPEAELHKDIDALCKQVSTSPRAVLKIILYRRSLGQRGYRPRCEAVDRIVSVNALHDPAPNSSSEGIHVEISPVKLSLNPQLAGIKHLNRLEQVQAAGRLAAGVDEALMQDAGGRLIEAISANLFLVIDGKLQTANLDQCGVEGIVRRKIIDSVHAGDLPCGLAVGPLYLKDLYAAEEAFICNSLNGVTPIRSVGCYSLEIGPVTKAVQNHFAQYWHVQNS